MNLLFLSFILVEHQVQCIHLEKEIIIISPLKSFNDESEYSILNHDENDLNLSKTRLKGNTLKEFEYK